MEEDITLVSKSLLSKYVTFSKTVLSIVMHSLGVSSSGLNALIELQESEKLWKSICEHWCHVRVIAFGHNLILMLSLRSMIRTAVLFCFRSFFKSGRSASKFWPQTLCRWNIVFSSFFPFPSRKQISSNVWLKGCLICNCTGTTFANQAVAVLMQKEGHFTQAKDLIF